MPVAQTEPASGDTAASLLEAVQGLASGIRDRADHIEQSRRLPHELVAALATAGLFRMCVPRALGGGEIDPATVVRVIEEVAQADGSAGWCTMIGATSGVVSAYLPEDVARDIYGSSPETVTGGVFAPLGKARAVEGGYQVTGRWAFASGAEHCTWLMGGCVIVDGDAVRLLPSGLPDARMMLFPAAAAQIIDTWTVSGLRGTGSHDIAVSDLFVPAERSVSLLTDRPRQPGPLYAFPIFGLLALGVAAVATGIARSAIDELIRLAQGKTATGGRKRLAERPVTQVQVAQAEAALRSGRAFLFEAIGHAWQTATVHGTISTAERAELRLAATNATLSAATAVDLMYNAGGGTSIYASSPLQRQFRDIHVVTQHMIVAPPTYELTGRLLLGIDTDTEFL